MTLFGNQRNRPLLIIVAAYQALMGILVLLHFSAVRFNILWILFHTAVILFLWWDKNESLNRFKIWSIIVIIPINFSELHYLVHTVHPTDYDNILIIIDYFLFGQHPTIWFEKYTYPLITELLQMVYTTFYFIPIILAVLLRKKDEQLNFFMFSMIYCFYSSYFGYFLVPAIGPRFTLDHLQNFSLEGVWIMQDIQTILNKLENIQRDAFPSGHTAITVLTLLYAFRYHKKYSYFLSPVTILLVISTVYLRYHYVIDVIAGLFLTAFIYLSAPGMYRFLSKRGRST